MRRIGWTAASLLLISLVIAPGVARSRDGGPEPGLSGSWEGFLTEAPGRLSLFGITLKPAGTGWEGIIDLPGAPGLPLSAIRSDGSALHFELRVEETLVQFDGARSSGKISGRAVEGERAFTFDMQKLPVYATPANRVEAWRQDLDVVRRRFLEYDRSFSPRARAAFDKALDRLEASLRNLNDQQVIVALSEAVALSGNAHTRLYLLRNRTELRRLPLRLYWFSDGLFVIRATPAHRDTIGCRVTLLAGRDPRWLRERVARMFAGNESWVDYKSPYFMTSPEILYGAGLIDDMERVPLRFQCDGREPFARALAPLPLRRTKEPTEAWRDLSPRWPGEGDGDGKNERDGIAWVAALQDVEPLPLYLRDPSRHYWSEYLQESKALYLQYNRSQDMPEGASVADFAAEVETFIGQHPIELLILDLRFNTGGNNGLAAKLMERLEALESRETIGRLYVITGRATFSAGISHAAWLKQHSDAIFVGEPIGDELDIWSEGGNIVLPNSDLTVHFTNGFHSLSDVEHPEFERYRWSNLDLENLEPDILVRPSSDDYFSGRDRAMEAILAEER